MHAAIFRFAPSPNGELHLGHALSALLNQQMARRLGGRLLLRIEDIDLARCTPAFEAAIRRDLKWLGIGWEEPVRRQSQHFGEYQLLLDRLIADELVYPAFMSRGEIRAHIAAIERRSSPWPRDPDGSPLYPGLERAWTSAERRQRIAAGEPHAWRLDVGRAVQAIAAPLSWREFSDEGMACVASVPADPLAWGDVVLARTDVPTSYHLSVVADDAQQGVSHVVRGRDLFAATAVQRLLQELLGLPAPAYFHHRLVVGPDGRKLSKSLHDTGIDELRAAGHTPTDLRRLLGLA